MAFKMKGSPHKMGTIEGTSAFRQKKEKEKKEKKEKTDWVKTIRKLFTAYPIEKHFQKEEKSKKTNK